MLTTDNLDDWLAELRAGLVTAAATPGHPWRLPVLGTAENNLCRLRTVVLRAVAPEPELALTLYTDSRSTKARQLARQPEVEWLFYHPDWRVQLRLEATATLTRHTDDCRRLWASMDEGARAAYRTEEPPGTPLAGPTDGLAACSTPDAGFAHFAVVTTRATRLDCVALRPTGNRRAIWAWADGEWIGSWVTP